MTNPGWYPDPTTQELRYSDGQQWLDIPAPPPKGPPTSHGSTGDSGPALTAPKLSYSAASDTFTGSLVQLMKVAMRAIENLRWTVVSANESLGLLTFETKMSWGSWSGVTCTLSFDELQPGTWRVSGSGKQNVRGAQLAALDMGEAKRKAAVTGSPR